MKRLALIALITQSAVGAIAAILPAWPLERQICCSDFEFNPEPQKSFRILCVCVSCNNIMNITCVYE